METENILKKIRDRGQPTAKLLLTPESWSVTLWLGISWVLPYKNIECYAVCDNYSFNYSAALLGWDIQLIEEKTKYIKWSK